MPHSSVFDVTLCTLGAAAGMSARSEGHSAENGHGFVDSFLQWADETAPVSWRAAGIATAAVVLASVVRGAIPFLGTDYPFATYFPALLLTGLIAGTPAAIGAALASTVVARWAFMPPAYQFGPITKEIVAGITVWGVSAVLLIVFTHYGRQVLHRLWAREQEHALIARELEHRGRNTYAVIQTIVQQSLQDDPDRAESILGRIRAVKYANDLLFDQPAHSAILDAVLAYEFAPYGPGRCVAAGPEVALPPDVARRFVLLVHELVTNAAKHGALSTSEGKVEIDWTFSDGRVLLQWKETGGPPVPERPVRKGFGTKLVAQCLRSLSGSIRTVFEPSGVSHEIEFAADEPA